MAVDHTRVSLRTGGGTEPLTTGSSFRQRCASALTHPATIAALAALLLNDLVFKTMWPGSWTTGKLSDLGWVVFASPLLAFLLSFPVDRSRTGQRAAFLVAYAGLPLLYAAFNTFAPLHDFILQGLSIASGGNAGSPLDVTDSLVIPLGLGVAVWVWRREVPSAQTLRLRGALLIAGVAALASVASSLPETEHGVTNVSPVADGTVIADASSTYRDDYWSEDGGRNWQVWLEGIHFGFEAVATQVDTPRGVYAIQGPEVHLLRPDGEQELVYSTRHMAAKANVWVQEHSTGHLGAREITTEPKSIVYDPFSGNVIVSMGIQGVIVGAPDGVWNEYAVGPYSPVDYSVSGKTRLLLSRVGFWVTALAISLSMIGASPLLSQFQRGDLSWLVPGGLAFLIILIVASWATAFGGVVILLLVLALVGGAIALRSWLRERRLNKGKWLPILAVLGLGALLLLGGIRLAPNLPPSAGRRSHRHWLHAQREQGSEGYWISGGCPCSIGVGRSAADVRPL